MGANGSASAFAATEPELNVLRASCSIFPPKDIAHLAPAEPAAQSPNSTVVRGPLVMRGSSEERTLMRPQVSHERGPRETFGPKPQRGQETRAEHVRRRRSTPKPRVARAHPGLRAQKNQHTPTGFHKCAAVA